MKINANGHLEFEVNGIPGNGDGREKKKGKVQWIVHPQSDVKSIEKIIKKTGPGAPSSTDIFSDDPPQSQGNHGTHWTATVNETASIGDEYHYDIYWVGTASGTVQKHDPKISVMP